jgi:hypothetical protein
MKKDLLIKSPCIYAFLESVSAMDKSGNKIKSPRDATDLFPRLGELLYAPLNKIPDGTKITFEFDDMTRQNNREVTYARLYIAREYDSAHVMLVFEGDNIEDPVKL